MLLISIVSVSYSYFKWESLQQSYNIAGTSCLSFSMINQENDINLDKTYPITDEEGKKLVPFTFSLKNECDTYVSYNVNLEDIIVDNVNRLSG